METKSRNLTMAYVMKLKDEGMRKVAIFKILYGYTDKKIAGLLKIQESTVETIGKKAGITIKRMMFKDMNERRGMIFNG